MKIDIFKKWKEFKKHCMFNSTLYDTIELTYTYRNVKFNGTYHIPETDTYIKVHNGDLQIMVKLENWKVYLVVERDYLCDSQGNSWSHDMYWLYDEHKYKFKYISDMPKEFVYDFQKELVSNHNKIKNAIIKRWQDEYYEEK